MLADRPTFEDLYRDFMGRIYAYVRAQVSRLLSEMKASAGTY